MQHQTLGADCLLWNDSLEITPQVDWFTPNFWQQQGAVTGTSHGRGTTYFVNYQGNNWVLRHYRRGGLVAHLSDDSYFFFGREKTRVWQEFKLLLDMHDKGLPVPKPIAGRISRHALWYRADILIEQISGAQDLYHQLQSSAMSPEEWQQVGRLIATFHNQGIYHADLNIHNILRDAAGKLYLIDFDRGEQREPSPAWQQANLDRLLRSCRKEAGRVDTWYWQESDWQHLVAGYKQVQEVSK
ncbi:3-deoxy-D-manno-octulosonic acid kinase [Corallincola platygyrae]|uniref:3-deoxy-D-manno-octulosonic acid kinase n=1 Tax=Corallincola platygyrae TaxID=1193278 RepID=A0ABW4XRN5_9GAMM